MKKVLLIFAAATLLLACNDTTKEPAAPERNDWANHHLKGMVQTMEETDFTPDSLGNIGEMDSCCVEVLQYNEKGFEITYSEKDITGAVTFKSVYERNEAGRFMSSTNTKDGKPDGSRKATRDADGKLIAGADYDAEGNVEVFYTDMIENDLGQPTSGKMFNADSSLRGTWGRHYIDGLAAGRSWNDSTGKLIYDYKGEVNDQGLLARMTGTVSAGGDSTTTTVATYTYDSFDETGNWTQRTEYDEDGKVTEVKKRAYTYYKED